MPEASSSQIGFRNPFGIAGVCCFIKKRIDGIDAPKEVKCRRLFDFMNNMKQVMMLYDCVFREIDYKKDGYTYIGEITAQFDMSLLHTRFIVYHDEENRVHIDVEEANPFEVGSTVTGYFYDKLEIGRYKGYLPTKQRQLVVHR